MRVAVMGLGAVGTRAARQLASTDAVQQVVVFDAQAARVQEVASSLGAKASAGQGGVETIPDADVVVLATPCGTQLETAGALVARGTPVVSTSDAIEDVRGLLDLGP